MMLDMTIRFGDLIVIVGMAVGMISAFYAVRGNLLVIGQRVTGIDNSMAGVQREISELSKIVVSNARLEEQLKAALLRITALEALRIYNRALERSHADEAA